MIGFCREWDRSRAKLAAGVANGAPDNGGHHPIAVRQPRTGSPVQLRKAAKRAVPAHNLRILRAVACAAVVDFVSPGAVGTDRPAQEELDFLEDVAALLIDRVHGRARRLIRPPGIPAFATLRRPRGTTSI